VRGNVGLYSFLSKNEGEFDGSCTEATRDAAVVLVKAATYWHVYLNVEAGDTICSCAVSASRTGLPGISHVSYFGCVVPQ